MRAANMASLTDKVVRPDFDKHLVPLLLYRGNVSFGRTQRLWNFALTLMESDVDSLSEAAKLGNNPAFSHLAGPVAAPQFTSLFQFWGRLVDNPKVTQNIAGLTEYVRHVKDHTYKGNWIGGGLVRLGVQTSDPRVRVPWREYAVPAKRPRVFKPSLTKQTLFYPYLIHEPKNAGGEYDLMREVTAAVPKGLPDYVRADICQDLIVAVLSGEIDRSELRGEARGFVRKVLAAHPLKYGPLSLDAPAPWDSDGRTLHETLGESGLLGGLAAEVEW